MRASTRILVIVGLALAIGLGTAVSPFASSSPDGLERVATDEGFIESSQPASIQESSPIPGYAFPGVRDERIATGLAGFLGTLVAFAIGYGIAAALARRRDGPAGGARDPDAAPS